MAFQSNAFQNNAFQIEAAVIVADAFNPTGIGAVVDFRKSDKAKAEFEARQKANDDDRKRAVYEAFYGKPPEPIDEPEYIDEPEPEYGPSEAVRQFAAMEAQRQQMQRMAQIRARNDADTIELLLMVS